MKSVYVSIISVFFDHHLRFTDSIDLLVVHPPIHYPCASTGQSGPRYRTCTYWGRRHRKGNPGMPHRPFPASHFTNYPASCSHHSPGPLSSLSGFSSPTPIPTLTSGFCRRGSTTWGSSRCMSSLSACAGCIDSSPSSESLL